MLASISTASNANKHTPVGRDLRAIHGRSARVILSIAHQCFPHWFGGVVVAIDRARKASYLPRYPSDQRLRGVTGNGNVPCKALQDYCLGLAYPGCADACVNRTVGYTFKNFTAPSSYSFFSFFFASPHPQKLSFLENFETETCNLSLNSHAPRATSYLCRATTRLFNSAVPTSQEVGLGTHGILDLLPILTCLLVYR